MQRAPNLPLPIQSATKATDRPIVNVRETWTAPDLKIIVYTTDDDPRTGSRTTELINLDRAEPDPALFQVPEGYTIKDQYPGSN
jgi:hypothetical protein